MDNNSTNETDQCMHSIPFSSELFRNQTKTGLILVICNWICVLFIVAIYVLEIVFVIRRFQTSYRKRNTISVLGLSPVYAICAIIGVMIPRSTLLVDLVANSYYGLAIYCLMGLIEDYLGTEKLVHHSAVKYIRLNTFPACCCCVCLPKPKFNRKTYVVLLIIVYQVTVVRPVIAFLAAVLWTDDLYVPGQYTATNAFAYLSAINLISTLFGVWGLVIIQVAFDEELLRHKVKLKFLYLQLALFGTSLGNIIIGSLVSRGIIPCAPFIPSAARAARIDNSYVVFWMVLVSLCGLVAFCRAYDGIVDKSRLYRKRRSVT